MSESNQIKIEILKLQNAHNQGWEFLEKEILKKRLTWFENNREAILLQLEGTDVEKAYQLLLIKLGITESNAPITEKTSDKIVFHSMNTCPTLEACKILGLDTREVCRAITEKPTEELIRQINPKLRFTRNYNLLRPNAEYCEEMIFLEKNDLEKKEG